MQESNDSKEENYFEEDEYLADDYNFEPTEDAELDSEKEEPIESQKTEDPVDEPKDEKLSLEESELLDDKIDQIKSMLEDLSSIEEKEDASYEPIEDSIDTLSLELDTSVELPYEAIESNEDVIEEFSDLPNESYDPEFEPKEEMIVASSIAVTEHLEAKPEVEVIKLDDETQEVEPEEASAQFSVIQPEENETAKFITLDTSIDPESEDLVSPQEEEAPFTVLQETKPLPPVTNVESLSPQKLNRNEEVDLDENPYFQRKRLNFKWTKLIVPTITLVIVLGLFVSIFLILHIFK